MFKLQAASTRPSAGPQAARHAQRVQLHAVHARHPSHARPPRPHRRRKACTRGQRSAGQRRWGCARRRAGGCRASSAGGLGGAKRGATAYTVGMQHVLDWPATRAACRRADGERGELAAPTRRSFYRAPTLARVAVGGGTLATQCGAVGRVLAWGHRQAVEVCLLPLRSHCGVEGYRAGRLQQV